MKDLAQYTCPLEDVKGEDVLYCFENDEDTVSPDDDKDDKDAVKTDDDNDDV